MSILKGIMKSNKLPVMQLIHNWYLISNSLFLCQSRCVYKLGYKYSTCRFLHTSVHYSKRSTAIRETVVTDVLGILFKSNKSQDIVSINQISLYRNEEKARTEQNSSQIKKSLKGGHPSLQDCLPNMSIKKNFFFSVLFKKLKEIQRKNCVNISL